MRAIRIHTWTRACLILTAALLTVSCGGSGNGVDNAGFPGLDRSTARRSGSPESRTGAYLAARHAQSRHDWSRASHLLDSVLAEDPSNIVLVNRAMVLAMGAGRYDRALALARLSKDGGGDNALALLLLTLESIRTERYADARTHESRLRGESVTRFVAPLLSAWAAAGLGESRFEGIQDNGVHLFHALLAADYLGDTGIIRTVTPEELIAAGLSDSSLREAAGAFLRAGLRDRAKDIYVKLFALEPEDEELKALIAAIEAGFVPQSLRPAPEVKTPQAGASRTLLDMATLLYHEHSDDSARLFAHMALYLDETRDAARILLAHLDLRNRQYGSAVKRLQEIPPEAENYAAIQRQIAEIHAERGNLESALAILSALVRTQGLVEAQIQIGDIYRREQDFHNALNAYDAALEMLDRHVTREYWDLVYARGMTLERLGRWREAEYDLRAALDLSPDQPYVLNYLGYSYADQGENLDEALEMIRRAVELRPDDGYITDSLGWIYYRLGEDEKAAAYLERAVELLPYDAVINDHLGDAYWQIGRKREARFQWRRALEHVDEADEQTLRQTLADKLEGRAVPERIPPGKSE